MGPENPLIGELRRALSEIAGVKVFLVGGSVRDLLLGRPLADYDFLLEGELFSFANLIGERLKCRVLINRKLLTASLETPWGEVDLSRARQETYQYPGALPQVTPATWQEDLPRRDFTINTLLLPLSEEGWGEVLDPLDGRRDLRAGLIRILHSHSFQDDPTRIIRAIRLKNRLDLTWEGETLACLEKAWPYLNLVSPPRRLKEWQLICQEKALIDILAELYQLGGWEIFFGNLPYSAHSLSGLAQILQEARGLKIRPWYLCLLILLAENPGSLTYLAKYWGLTLSDRQSLAETLLIYAELGPGLPTKSRMLYRRIKKLPLESIFYLYTQVFQANYNWESFWQELQAIQLPLRGRDLLNLGFAPGLQLGKALRELERAYWLEEYTTREDGLRLACRLKQEENNV